MGKKAWSCCMHSEMAQRKVALAQCSDVENSAEIIQFSRSLYHFTLCDSTVFVKQQIQEAQKALVSSIWCPFRESQAFPFLPLFHLSILSDLYNAAAGSLAAKGSGTTGTRNPTGSAQDL
jgi:hypothetical protein